jgi:hypothetical protein
MLSKMRYTEIILLSIPEGVDEPVDDGQPDEHDDHRRSATDDDR